ncbi:MAG: hypothetical protein J5922_03075 [Clostridia bacterium]|nr:hypothetical protein [Clostridia bacterium]
MNFGFADFIKKHSMVISVLLGISALILLILAPKGDTPMQSKKDVTENFDLAEYTEDVENKIKQIVKSLSDCDECEILITFQDDGENVYAEEETNVSADVFAFGESESEKLIIKHKFPKICGVLGVCPNISSAERANIIKGIASLFDISYSRIEIMSKQ